MNNRILVAHASKHGATGEIAVKIGEVLHQAGFEVDVLPAQQVGELTPYVAVVLGSGIYAGQWLKEAVNFLEAYEKQLAERPVWLFSSGPTGEGDPEQLLKGWRFPQAQQPIADRIRPRDIIVFGGELDTDKLNFFEKVIIKGVKAPTGDFRDWEAVTRWANGIAEVLKQPVVQPAT